MMALMGLFVMVLGVSGMIWGDRVLFRKRTGLIALFSFPQSWARILKWPIGAGIFFMGLMTLVLGLYGWGVS
ncbi:hypothetical protein [Pseudomonas sp. D2002]|jgi:hypothetical protein|uniref:hypothetical protein n=1 Tax=Pseudomonas sp. D2002 TaxID=2726980 RepID=UPI0015A3904F|nr:hypothetical protein [Pseudomonas sp. D2002]NWA84242.1 hypothetical protein [Pseudomonas sp. D2002]